MGSAPSRSADRDRAGRRAGAGGDGHWATGAKAVAGPTTGTGHPNVHVLGKSVFTTYLFAFEATAGLLVIAVVGAVVLARRPRPAPPEDEPRRGADDGDERRPPRWRRHRRAIEEGP